MRLDPSPPGAAADAPPAGAVLIRVLVADATRVGVLPVVPGGHRITASISDLRLLPAVELLEARGYAFVGVHAVPVGAAEASVDLLVDGDTRIREPDLWRDLLLCADRVFALELGPVRRVLAELIAVHRRA